MSGCSLVAAGLPSLVGTATPTFSYNNAAHPLGAYDNFGIQMTYMSGTSTCFSGTRPTFTPVISNPYLLYTRTCSYSTQGAPATYTGIYCGNADLWYWVNSGAYTIDNYVALNLFNPFQQTITPQPFTATFGTSPGPLTVASTTAFVTSTNTYTATAAPQPAATTTVTSASATTTRTSTATSTFPVTSPFTQTVSSCPITSATPLATTTQVLTSTVSPSSSPVSSPLSSSSPLSTTTQVVTSTASPSPSSSPVATTTVVSVVTSSPSTSPVATTTVVSTVSPSPSSSPVATTTVVSVVTSSPASSLSSSPAAASTTTRVLTSTATPLSSSAPIVSSSSSPVATTTVVSTVTPSPSFTSSSSPSSSSVTPTSVSPSPSATPAVLSCPESNGQTFLGYTIECFVDRYDFDMGIAPSNPATYAQCIQACASTNGCKAVSYLPNGPCYLKSGLGAPNSNSNVWGAALVIAASSQSSAVASSSTAVAPSSAAAASSSVAASTSAAAAAISSQAASTTTVLSTTVVTATSSASPAASVICPGSNGQSISISGNVYLVECSSDYVGADFPGPISPVFPGSFENCMAACASTSGCVAASYVINGPCYLKSAVTGANINSNIIGGRLIRAGVVNSSSAVAISSAVANSSPVASSAPVATSSAAVKPVAPSTVTVTTIISNTGYQCACTPTAIFVPSSSSISSSSAAAISSVSAVTSSAPAAAATGAALDCPTNNGTIYTSSCGAVYAIECAADRYGNDIENGLAFTKSLNECLAVCDVTAGCVDVSWVVGSPGPCYMKGSIGAIRENSNIFGGRQISGCTTSKTVRRTARPLKLHRKRVAPAEPKKPLGKRTGFFGPDFTFTQSYVTATVVSTAVTTVSTTSTPFSGTATSTSFTLASTTVTTTTSVPTTVYNIVSVTTCPTASPTI